VACVRADHQGLEKRQRRASSLRTWRWRERRSPCSSCPTTHPPYVPRPSAVDHLDRDMLQRLTCSRTATVVCVVCTSGSLRAERGVGDGCEWRSAVGFGRLHREPGGAPWAGGSVSSMAALSGFKAVARLTSDELTRLTARRMAGANAAKRRAASRRLKATRASASRMAGENGAKRRAVPSQLILVARSDARRMAGANGAKRRAAPSPLKATRITASRIWWRQAVPAQGLHQGGSRRHGALRVAWRWQTVPRGGPPQGSSNRRHATLVMNLQFSILMAQTTDPSSWH
jgi:hypothetical protein